MVNFIKKILFIFSLILLTIGLTPTYALPKSIIVTWNSNMEDDLEGYIIYDKFNNSENKKMGVISKKFNTFKISNISNGTHVITVIAYDYNGNKSIPSDPFIFIITDSPSKVSNVNCFIIDN